jgi:cytochrome c556
VELEPNNREAAIIAARLQPIVEERREKLKEEMMGKLKDLGNMVLGKFGMSLDNFQTVQDPATGGYSINFKQ